MQSHSNLPIKQQFHWSRFCLRYHDSRVFAISRLVSKPEVCQLAEMARPEAARRYLGVVSPVAM